MNLTMPLYNSTMYNSGCWRELDIMAQKCEDFHANIMGSITTRFYITIGLLFAVLLFRLYVTYVRPSWSQTKFFQEKILYRIDYIETIIILCIFALLMM